MTAEARSAMTSVNTSRGCTLVLLISPMVITRTFITSFAPFMETQMKCSCFRSAKCRMRGSTSGGNLIFKPSGFIRLRTNSRAAAINVALAEPIPSTSRMSPGPRLIPFWSMILMSLLEIEKTSFLLFPFLTLWQEAHNPPTRALPCQEVSHGVFLPEASQLASSNVINPFSLSIFSPFRRGRPVSVIVDLGFLYSLH